MKFIHLSDLHILARNDASRLPDAAATLRKVIEEVNTYHADAEVCIITGDITHRGTPEQYENAVEILSSLTIPYLSFRAITTSAKHFAMPSRRPRPTPMALSISGRRLMVCGL